jgi:hypothetical protein
MIELLDPQAVPGLATTDYACRFEPADGRVVGLLSNSFIDAAEFLEDLQQLLALTWAGVRYHRYDKQHIRNSTFPLAATEQARIADECDAVVTAYGHCGSCTSGTVRDAVAFALLGTPVVALVTQRFADEARFVARAAGVPEVPIVILPHPVAGRDREFHQQLSRAIAPVVVEALTTGTVPTC